MEQQQNVLSGTKLIRKRDKRSVTNKKSKSKMEPMWEKLL